MGCVCSRLNYVKYHFYYGDLYEIWIVERGTCGGAVGSGTALQVGRSRVRFPMLSLEFFIDIFLPAAIWTGG